MKLVKIGRVNGKIKEMAMNDSASLAEVIKASGIEINDNDDISVDDAAPITNFNNDVHHGALIIIKPRMQFGARCAEGSSFDSEPAETKFAMIVWNISHAPDIKTAERIAHNYSRYLKQIGIA